MKSPEKKSDAILDPTAKVATGATVLVRKSALGGATVKPKATHASLAYPLTKPTLPGKAVQQSAGPLLKAAVKSEVKPVGKAKPASTIPAKKTATTAVKVAKKDVAPVVSASVAPAPLVAPRPVPSPIPMSSLKPPPPRRARRAKAA